MGAAISVGDGVRVTKNLIVVTVIVLDHDIDEHIFCLIGDDNGLGVDDCFIGAQLPDELLNAIAVKELLGPVVLTIIHQRDLHARIQERQFPQAGGQQVELKLLRDGEDLGIRFKHHIGAGVIGFANDFQIAGGFAPLKFHCVHFAVTTDLHLEPFRQSVHTLGAYAVETAGIFVGALSEFTASMEIREHQFHSRDFEFRMDIHRNTAAVVPNGD